MNTEAPGPIASRDASDDPQQRPSTDRGLRIMLKWVFGALILTVLFGMLVVELTMRWFR
jgi:hypothetical protein